MKLKICLVFSVLTSLLALAQLTAAQTTTTTNPLKQRIKNFHLERATITRIITELSADYKIPIGLETVFQQELRRNIDVRDSDLTSVLDLIVTSFPGYRWSQVDGVINISPSINQENILGTVISRYKTDETLEVGLRSSITNLPEVKNRLKEIGV